jgi:hypothetical protein
MVFEGLISDEKVDSFGRSRKAVSAYGEPTHESVSDPELCEPCGRHAHRVEDRRRHHGIERLKVGTRRGHGRAPEDGEMRGREHSMNGAARAPARQAGRLEQ